MIMNGSKSKEKYLKRHKQAGFLKERSGY